MNFTEIAKADASIEAKVEAISAVLDKKLDSLVNTVTNVSQQVGPKGDKGDRGLSGKDGKDGVSGRDGRNGSDGKDGIDGSDGEDGVGVTNARVEFDGSLVLTLSDGNEIDAGTVIPENVNSLSHSTLIAPYGAATGTNRDITSLENAEHIQFDTEVQTRIQGVGKLQWDEEAGTLQFGLSGGEVNLQIGQEQVVKVRNYTGTTIYNGQIVYISGANGTFPTVSLAQANADVTSRSTLGMSTQDIPPNGYGFITISGIVHDLDTSGYTIGSIIYLSATEAGGLTPVAPLQPNYVIVVGYVTRVDSTTGSMFIHIDKQAWFPSLELLDTRTSVELPSTPTILKPPTTGINQGFTYDSATGEITILQSGSFAFNMMLNILAPSSGKSVYFYIEVDTGSGFQIRHYSGRGRKLPNNDMDQVTISSSNYFTMGTKVRFYLWGSDTGITLHSLDIPGTSTATIPALRLLWA